MKASVFIATSLDGFIARPDGALDWLPADDGEAHGYEEFIATVDAIVIGRKTFETVLGFEAWPYGTKPVVVLSTTPTALKPPRGVPCDAMTGTPHEIVARLARRGLTHLYVDGGVTIQRFIEAGLIQRLIITRVPVLLGSGIPLSGHCHATCGWSIWPRGRFPAAWSRVSTAFSRHPRGRAPGRTGIELRAGHHTTIPRCRVMTQPLRDTRYARELAKARQPSGPGGRSFVAIERIFVKKTQQVEIRFSSWEGSRMLPRPLDLPEDELLSLMGSAVEAEVFSEEFMAGLRSLLGIAGRGTGPTRGGESTELGRIQAHFHDLIRSRAAALSHAAVPALPSLSAGAGTDDDPVWLPIEGMNGGFRYWWDATSASPRLMAESWSRTVAGSGQLHEITTAGARLLGEGFV